MKISVVIPVYNQADYIGEAIDSALRQSFPPYEIIVVNDGSTDGTEEVCSRFADRIVYVPQANAGPSAARNHGLRRAGGDAVVFLDADDVLCPTWLEEAAAAYRRAREGSDRVGAVYSDYVVFDDAGRYQTHVKIRRIDLPGLLRDPLLIPSGAFVTRAFWEDVGDFNVELPTCEDWEYWLRGALQGYRFVRVPVQGFRHREHPGSLSKQEIPALEGRAKFLQLWVADERLSPAQRSAIRYEISRTLLRLRRAAYFQGKPTAGYVPDALRLSPEIVRDPWFFVFGAVYAAPFFRAQIRPDQSRKSIEDLFAEVAHHLAETGSASRAALQRLRASARIGMAANQALDGRRGRAALHLARGVLADPRLTLDPLVNARKYVTEFVRAAGGL